LREETANAATVFGFSRREAGKPGHKSGVDEKNINRTYPGSQGIKSDTLTAVSGAAPVLDAGQEAGVLRQVKVKWRIVLWPNCSPAPPEHNQITAAYSPSAARSGKEKI